MRIIRIKNIQAESDEYCGKTYEPGEYYTLQEGEDSKYATDGKFNEHLWYDEGNNPKVLINNGEKDLSPAEGDIWLKHIDKLTTDGKQITQQTPRPLGTYTYFTGSDDDNTDPHAVGGDENVNDLAWSHSMGDPLIQEMYFKFNTIMNETHIRQGSLQWEEAKNDFLSLLIVPSLTDYEAGTDTEYNLYGGFLIIPAAGDGLISVADEDRVLIQCVPNEFGAMPAGYWDATWNTATKQFDAINPNYSGEGEYNMFGSEEILHRFMNRKRMLSTFLEHCSTDDVARLGHNMLVKLILQTIEPNHAWSGNAKMMLYRKKTC